MNAQMVTDFLQTAGVKKAAAQKALDTLCEKEAISFKDFGDELSLAKRERHVSLMLD